MKSPKRNVYGKMPIEPINLVRRLNKRWPRGKGRFYPETQDLFEFLERMGKSLPSHIEGKVVTKKGFRAFYLDKKHRQKAFLLDYLWWSSSGTLLAAESEFGYGIAGMQHDFEKLLCWKSPLKLMIVREHRKISAELIRKELSVYASTVPQLVKGECFVLFVFGKVKNSAYIYVAPRDGAPKFNFETLNV